MQLDSLWCRAAANTDNSDAGSPMRDDFMVNLP